VSHKALKVRKEFLMKIPGVCQKIPGVCLDQVLLFLCDAADLLQAGAACCSWRSSSVKSDAWQVAFVRTWSRRQKPELEVDEATGEPVLVGESQVRISLRPGVPGGFVRGWWQHLLNEGLAEPAGLSITSNPSQLLRFSQQEKPNPCAYKDSTSTWHRRFVSAAWDMWTRSTPTVRELCYDFCYDDQSDQNFPRCWYLFGNQLEEFSPELQFQPDGTIKEHRNNRDRESEWRWRWVESHALQQSQSYRSLAMIKTSWDHPAQIIEFQFHRSADAGFVLVGQDGTKLCSREKTIQEHIFRRHHGEPQYPRFVQQAVQALADQADGPSVSFPAELTGFECLSSACVMSLLAAL
jgi:hypothetical protein